VRKLAIALRDSVIEAGLPFFEHWATASAVLEGAASGELQVPSAARFTIACGALLNDRPDLARMVIAPIGTASRESMARLLGFFAEEET
jgi:hypothetical protein